MSDTNIEYSEQFGIDTFKRELCSSLGDSIWNELINGIDLPDIHTEHLFGCSRMHIFMERLEKLSDSQTVKKILYKVRHGLRREQSLWARDMFLKVGDLDKFLKSHLESELCNFEKLNKDNAEWYGQLITDNVLNFIKEHTTMLAPKRMGNKLYCTAFPFDMQNYIAATDIKMKRYYACHCPFARESILTEKTVSDTLCNCSLGHVMNFIEAFLDRELTGRVVSSVLGGSLLCEYEIDIPDDIMAEYVDIN